MKKCDVIVDLQFGSTGKGAIAGYLANKHKYDAVVSANMPNAGHTFIDAAGKTFIHKVLPSGLASECAVALIAPAAVFSMEQLVKELHVLEDAGYTEKHVYIHEHAVLLTPDHKLEEAQTPRPGSTDINTYQLIGSTQQGSAAALMHKIRRDINQNPTAVARYGLGLALPDSRFVHVIGHREYLDILADSQRVLLEGSQGYSLGLNAGFYPYCTSRDCTTTRLLADALIPAVAVNQVIGTARTYPIRVGGTSGPGYFDQEEWSWERLGQKAERTTVTNRVRRVFTFSEQQIREAIQQSSPTQIFLNFCNYQTEQENGILIQLINNICRDTNGFGSVKYTGHGPAIGDIKELNIGH